MIIVCLYYSYIIIVKYDFIFYAVANLNLWFEELFYQSIIYYRDIIYLFIASLSLMYYEYRNYILYIYFTYICI